MNQAVRVKAIIADDEQHIRKLIGLALTTMKAEVLAEARDGQQAVELYQSMKPDIIFMDLNMPVLDGVSAIKKVRALDPHACAIVITSMDSSDLVNEALDAGAAGYILKSTPIEEIKKLILETWEAHKAALGQKG